MKTFDEFILEDTGSTDRCCVLHYLDERMSTEIRAKHLTIQEEDLHENGIETHPHITVLYGLLKDEPQRFIRAMLDLKVDHKSWEGNYPAYTLGKFSLFENEEFDVLKAEVDSPHFHQLNAFFRHNVEYENNYPDYTPHVTIAYLKPGAGKKYVNDVHSVEGLNAQIGELTHTGYKDSNGQRTNTTIDLHPFSMNMRTEKK